MNTDTFALKVVHKNNAREQLDCTPFLTITFAAKKLRQVGLL